MGLTLWFGHPISFPLFDMLDPTHQSGMLEEGPCRKEGDSFSKRRINPHDA